MSGAGGPLFRQISGRKVVCCVGPGGVGKTTTSAAIGLQAAMAGKRVLVLTIDPARRLANSLGLAALGNRETEIDLSKLQGAGAGGAAKGQLFAMMLDLQLSWDELVRREAPTPERAEAILKNRVYKTLSTGMAGSLEYMAMEKLYDVASQGRFDQVVLDTPPTANALDFLHAASRILDVLDNDTLRKLLGPMLRVGKVGLRFFASPTSIVLKTLARFTGTDFLQDLGAFFAAFDGMYDGFQTRARNVKKLLASPEAGFVLVTSPSPLAIDEALFFHRALTDEHIPTVAAVVNRVQRDPHRFGGADTQPGLHEALALSQMADGGEPPLSQRLARTLSEQTTLADSERREVERFRLKLAGVPLVPVPRLRRDVHDLASLWQIVESLSAEPTP